MKVGKVTGMGRLPTMVLAALMLITGVVTLGLLYAEAAPRAVSDRQADGFRGPVASVVVEAGPIVERDGQWLVGARATESSTRYDRTGRFLETSRYLANNDLDYRLVHSYQDGRLVEETSYDADGELLYRWVHSYDGAGLESSLSGYDASGRLDFRHEYRYDDRGRLVREASLNGSGWNAGEEMAFEAAYVYGREGKTRTTRYYTPGGVADYTTVETFDQAGRLVEEAGYGVSGEPQYRVTYRYDRHGHLVEETAYDAAGAMEYRLRNRYDRAGNLVETAEHSGGTRLFYRYTYEHDRYGNVTRRTSYNPDGSVAFSARNEYEVDRHGNWTERATERALGSDGDAFVPVEVTYRRIEYY